MKNQMLICLQVLLVSLTACPKKSIEITPAVKKVEDCTNLFKDSANTDCCKMTLTEAPLNTEFKLCKNKSIKLGSRIMYLSFLVKYPQCPEGSQCLFEPGGNVNLKIIDSTCKITNLILMQDPNYSPNKKDTLGYIFSVKQIYDVSQQNANVCYKTITLKIDKK